MKNTKQIITLIIYTIFIITTGYTGGWLIGEDQGYKQGMDEGMRSTLLINPDDVCEAITYPNATLSAEKSTFISTAAFLFPELSFRTVIKIVMAVIAVAFFIVFSCLVLGSHADDQQKIIFDKEINKGDPTKAVNLYD